MEYRIHPGTGDKISVIGVGTGPMGEGTEKEAAAALTYACEQGVNFLTKDKGCLYGLRRNNRPHGADREEFFKNLGIAPE